MTSTPPAATLWNEKISLAAVVDSSDDAIVGCSVTGIIRTWNGGAERLYGYSAQEAIGQHVRMLVPPELHDELYGMLTACIAGEPIRNVQTVRLAKDGTAVDVSISAAPIARRVGPSLASPPSFATSANSCG